jgi:hypothetical protein
MNCRSFLTLTQWERRLMLKNSVRQGLYSEVDINSLLLYKAEALGSVS